MEIDVVAASEMVDDELILIAPLLVCRVSAPLPGLIVIAPDVVWIVSVAPATVGPSVVVPEYASPPSCHAVGSLPLAGPVGPTVPAAPMAVMQN